MMKDIVKLQKTLYTSKNPTRRWLHSQRRDWVNAKILQYSSDGDNTVLEIGTGVGAYVDKLLSISRELTIADVEESFLEYSKEKYEKNNIKFVVDDLLDTSLPKECFDLILFSEVLEHIENTDLALANLMSLLKPGGIIIFSTPQKYSFLELCSKVAYLPGVINVVRWIYGESIMEAGHISLLTARNLNKKLKEVGFKVVESSKAGMYIPLVAEFGGNLGLKFEKFIESHVSKSFLDNILWCQRYILTK